METAIHPWSRTRHPRPRKRHMKKRRLSIQAIFNHDQPRETKFKTLPRSFTIQTVDDDSFLLDDDPFADLTHGPRPAAPAPEPVSLSSPTSPLASPSALPPTLPPLVPPPVPTRAVSHTHAHTTPTPAYQKPAFKPRPSLPSLQTLAQMNVAVPHKVRKGRVGAGLPFEPWDLDTEAFTASPASASSAEVPPIPASSAVAIPIPIPEKHIPDEDDLSTTPTPAAPTSPPHVLSSPPPHPHPIEVLDGLASPQHATSRSASEASPADQTQTPPLISLDADAGTPAGVFDGAGPIPAPSHAHPQSNADAEPPAAESNAEDQDDQDSDAHSDAHSDASSDSSDLEFALVAAQFTDQPSTPLEHSFALPAVESPERRPPQEMALGAETGPALGRNTSRRLLAGVRPAIVPRRTSSLRALGVGVGVGESKLKLRPKPRQPAAAEGSGSALLEAAGAGAVGERVEDEAGEERDVAEDEDEDDDDESTELPYRSPPPPPSANASSSRSHSSSVSRTHSRAPSERGIPEEGVLFLGGDGVHEEEDEVEGYVHWPRQQEQLDMDGDDAERDDDTRLRRRRFRKSSLVGDVLRFAPASPNAPSALASPTGGAESRAAAAEPKAMELELDEADVQLMGGMGVRVDGTGVDIQLGAMELALDDLDLDLDLDFGGRGDLQRGFGGGGGDHLQPAFELDAGNRTSAFSTANDIGHEPLEGSEEEAPFEFPAAYEAPLHEYQYDYASPDSTRSPERSYESERYEFPAHSSLMHSPPYSTPCATSAASSVSSVSVDEHAHASEFDFGWLPHERGHSASTSDYEYEYDAGSGSSSDWDGSELYTQTAGTAAAQPASASVSSPPASFSSTVAYSDEELAGLDFAPQQGSPAAHVSPTSLHTSPIASTSAHAYADASPSPREPFAGARSFVFPPRPHALAPEEVVEPGTSAGTIRASAQARGRARAGGVRDEAYWAENPEGAEGGEMVDASGWEGAGSSGGRGYTSGGGAGGSGRARSTGRGGGGDQYGSYGAGGGWAGGAGDGDGGDDRRNNNRSTRASAFSTPSDSDEDEDDDSDEDSESEDDYYGDGGQTGSRAGGSNNHASGSVSGAGTSANTGPAARATEGSDDDDVPLAQRIPSALKAQKTIRRKVREERDQRRRERASGRREDREAADAERRSRQETLRPAGAGTAALDIASSSSREAARQAEAAMARAARQRTQTLPGGGPIQAGSQVASAAVDDLTKKLQSMQAQQPRSLAVNTAATGRERERRMLSPSPVRGVSASASPPPQYQALPEGERGLRAMRSFRRPATAGGVAREEGVPLPQDAEARVKRSTTTTRRGADDSTYHSQGEELLAQDGGVRRSKTTSRRPDHPSEEVPLPTTAPVRRSATTRRPAEEAQRAPRERGLTMPAFLSEPPPPSPVPAAAPAPSNKLTKARPSGEMLPAPPRVSGEAPQTHRPSQSNGTLTRVFVGDMQRFNMVDIGPATSAKQVLAMVEEQGTLKGWVGTGGWMVWEVAQDFGMERPIRSFELLADVQASWNKDKMVNTFIIKLTPLAPILSRSNIPSSSPVYSGFVDWEMKRGKWTKRYLRLREHSLYLSKRESNKDEIFLCSLSNFDAYTVTRLHKAPKPFVFAIKSTDNLSFFENTADYMHIFACNPKDGEKWIEKVLLARSYVLHQERQVLFNPKSPAGNAATPGASGLSRAPTRKAANTPQRPAQQPLVTVAPLLSTPDRNDVFAPGSLLHGAPAGAPATQ